MRRRRRLGARLRVNIAAGPRPHAVARATLQDGCSVAALGHGPSWPEHHTPAALTHSRSSLVVGAAASAGHRWQPSSSTAQGARASCSVYADFKGSARAAVRRPTSARAHVVAGVCVSTSGSPRVRCVCPVCVCPVCRSVCRVVCAGTNRTESNGGQRGGQNRMQFQYGWLISSISTSVDELISFHWL